MSSFFRFLGGATGGWQVTAQHNICGEALPIVQAVDMIRIDSPQQAKPMLDYNHFCIDGFVSNLRYTEAQERRQLLAVQEGLGRVSARCAAIIPIKKSAAWWALAQDERRQIFEQQSKHIQIGMAYLPQIARQLHHSRDLGEPFDFITWFEFAPEHTPLFDAMLMELRQSPEWQYVEREVDIRLQLHSA